MVKLTFDEHKSTFPKFCFVGALSTIFNYSLFYLLFTLNVNYLLSSASGYVAGTLLGFVLNKLFTFKTKETPYKPEILKYFIVYSISLLIGLLLLKILVISGINVLISNFLIIGVTTITNYVGTKYVVFSKSLFISKLDYILFRYRYLITYVFIGLLSIILEIITIHFIRHILKVYSFGAYIAGFIAGVIFSYVLNIKINFNIPTSKKWRNFYIFLGISTFSYLLNIALLFNIISYLSTTSLDYPKTRIITAGIIFLVSYALHRKITFKDTKEVGIAIYLDETEIIDDIYKKIKHFPDWIHLDIVDKTIKKDSPPVRLGKGFEVRKKWPKTLIMTHIMSKHPKKYINRVSEFSDVIILHFREQKNLIDLILDIKKRKRKVGICIDSNYGIYNVPDRILKEIDFLQVLGVKNPGISGQKLEYNSIIKLKEIKRMKRKNKFKFDLIFDGGVKLTNIDKIDAKYIVSGSEVLGSPNPKRSIFNLKTSGRYYDKNIKEFIKENIFIRLKKLDFLISGNIVGSFSIKEEIGSLSDIDVVIIVDKLNKSKFKKIIDHIEEVGKLVRSRYGYNYLINHTFGPLKFDDENTIVFHVMVYDLKGHKEHCINSPFTCFEWELTNLYVKRHIKEIFPIRKLYPSYFLNSRRSILSYINDLKKESISYREYEFTNGRVIQKKKLKKMNNRDKIEYSYHIMKFLMINFLKLYYHKNIHFKNGGDAIKKYFKIFPLNKSKHTRFFKKIEKSKEKKSFDRFDSKDLNSLSLFLNDFLFQFKQFFYETSNEIIFLRHQKTRLNKKGYFLGQRNDPSIDKIDESKLKKIGEDLKKNHYKIFSSSSRRSIETAKILYGIYGKKEIVIEPVLNEIDYGVVDGKNFKYLKEHYPEIIEQWNRGEDPKFPGGENMSEVLKRVKKFLNKIRDEKEDCIILTHNVFLRCLIGILLKIPIKDMYKINIEHLETIKILKTENNNLYIDMDSLKQQRILNRLISG